MSISCCNVLELLNLPDSYTPKQSAKDAFFYMSIPSTLHIGTLPPSVGCTAKLTFCAAKLQFFFDISKYTGKKIKKM